MIKIFQNKFWNIILSFFNKLRFLQIFWKTSFKIRQKQLKRFFVENFIFGKFFGNLKNIFLYLEIPWFFLDISHPFRNFLKFPIMCYILRFYKMWCFFCLSEQNLLIFTLLIKIQKKMVQNFWVSKFSGQKYLCHKKFQKITDLELICSTKKKDKNFRFFLRLN